MFLVNFEIMKSQGGVRLTLSEIEILFYIKEGFTSAQIAKLRNCSVRTIEKHRSNIISKLKIPSSQNALLVWILKHPDLFNT
ncbi:helix-turn-helix transcriptional regulator [Tenacibaculum sp. IB213877]|uniref:helix-turn-helix transcriptional regulator n=1 Tax=Tenacibaculum sp. IB213877 TaxID=3097351 RepID=UPI0039B961B8